MSLSRRDNVVISGTASNPVLGNAYTVAVGSAGARAAAASTGTTITVDADHGFAAGDKLINVTTGIFVTDVLSSVTSTTLVYASATPSISLGDQLFNLGADTSTGASPNYDALGSLIFSDPDGGTAATNPITCDSLGNYGYYYNDVGLWELIRDSSGVVSAVIPGYNYAGAVSSGTSSGTSLPASSTRGYIFTVLGGVGVADITYVWQKGSDDAEDWTPIVAAP